MIEVKINGVTKWQVNEYTFNDPQMGIRSINMTVKHPSMWVDGVAPDTADFTGAYVDYEGEKYSISSSKPTAEKSNTSLDYIYTLIFKGEEEELTRRKVRNLALVSFDNYVSQGTTFSIYADINQFKQLLENNLRHYFGNKWSINLSVSSSDSVRIDVSNVTLWDLLSKTYEYFGVRFNIRGNTINIGYEPEEIYHVFDYGNDGGLVKITKTAPDTSIVNRLSGMGGSRNVPMNYFTDRYSEFDPDPNPINSSVNIRNIMPKVFRDSVVSGDYKDYVEDLASIASHGVREDALAPNEDIYPSIAGVEVSGLGRIDEIIAVSEVIADKPDDENYSPTFHIWVKNIGFNLADEQYTSTQDAKISFTTGVLTGYEFTILANGKIREVVEDTSKSFNGVSSKYRITLINSDEDFDATGRVLPNTVLKPSAGDHFVIYDIEMPFSYVANAEQRVQDWLEANLADLKEEKPTFSIEPMPSFFETAPVEFDGKTIKEKLRAGNKIAINTDTEQKLHINNLTIQYGGLMPKYSFTVTDRVQVQGSTVARMQSQLDGVMSRQLLTERDIETLLSGFSTKYLSKVKPDIAQQFIRFLKGISVKDLVYLAEGLEIGNYTSGLLGSGAKFKMNEGISELEVDKLSVRMRAEFFSVLIHNAKHIGGELIISAANMICNKVEEFPSFYRCYFDRGENNEVNNLFTNQDRARCQVFTGAGQKFYWRKVLAVGSDYIELSKTDASPGSNDIPEVGDHIFQLGSDNIDRQSAMIFSSVGADAPSFKQYAGINGYSLVDKGTTVFTSKGNRIQGKTVFTSGGQNLDEFADGVAGDIQDAQQKALDAERQAQDAIQQGVDNMTDINLRIAGLQDQIDGSVSNWFYPYVPTLSNYPASEWTTNELKNAHIGDTFTNTEPAPAPNSGKSWRFVEESGVYKWVQISDSDALLALQKAMEALSVADGKSTTFLVQPSNYSVGDMWVLNADQTVNGTAYKQGEILTATQDSATYNQSHWLKRIRYTDDTAIDNLEIGGRNLLRNSIGEPKYFNRAGYNLYPSSADIRAIAKVVPGSTVSITVYLKLLSDAAGTEKVRINIRNFDINGEYIGEVYWGNELTRAGDTELYRREGYVVPSNTHYLSPYVTKTNSTNPVEFELGWTKVEKGNKATDWSPAPEDVQAEVDSAKQEALTASNNVQTNVDNLNTYMDGVFKDDLIDSAEAKAIEKYLNSLSETKLGVDSSYSLLFNNEYLEGTAKTNLSSSKNALNIAYTNLINSVNAVIAWEQNRLIISSIVQPSTVSVVQGLTPSLPATITLNISDGTTRVANVTWSTHNTDTAGVQTLTGYYELPSGIVGGKPSVTLSLNVIALMVSSVVQPSGVTVTEGDAATLPTTVRLNINNGTTRDVAVTWSTHNTNTVGVQTLTGTYNLPSGITGSKPAVSLKLTVIAKVLTITSVVKPQAITVQKGGSVTMPTTVTLNISDGTTRTVNVTWGSYSTATEGTFNINGTYNLPSGVTGSKPTVTQVLNVIAQLTVTSVVQPSAVSVQQGGTPALPTSVTLNISDGSTRTVNVTWSSYNTSTVGTQTLTGSYNLPSGVNGSKPAVTLTLTVTPVQQQGVIDILQVIKNTDTKYTQASDADGSYIHWTVSNDSFLFPSPSDLSLLQSITSGYKIYARYKAKQAVNNAAIGSRGDNYQFSWKVPFEAPSYEVILYSNTDNITAVSGIDRLTMGGIGSMKIYNIEARNDGLTPSWYNE